MFHSRISKTVLVTIVILIFATTAYAFAASNTVPNTGAGEGSGTVSGYTVTAVQYHLNATNASNIDSVTFTLNAAATDVKIRLVTTGSYYDCSNTLLDWTCATTSPQATVLAANEFRVIAGDVFIP
jgi:hypothetical protein